MTEVVHRQACTALQELRDFMDHFLVTVEPAEFHESDAAILVQARHVRNRGHIFCMLEELQTHLNCMESALYQQKEYFELKQDVKKLRKQKKRLEEQIAELEEEYEDDI